MWMFLGLVEVFGVEKDILFGGGGLEVLGLVD